MAEESLIGKKQELKDLDIRTRKLLTMNGGTSTKRLYSLYLCIKGRLEVGEGFKIVQTKFQSVARKFCPKKQ